MQFVLLVLQLHAIRAVVLEDLAPRIEQIDDAALNTAQALVALILILDWLLAHAIQEKMEEPSFQLRPHVTNVFNALRWRHPWLDMARQCNESSGKSPIHGASRKGRDAPNLDRSVERGMVMAESFVMGSVARLMVVQ